LKNNNSAGFFCILMLLCALAAPGRAGAASAPGTTPADSARAPASAHPPLWIRAVQTFVSNKDLVPGKALQKMQEVDDKGRVKSQTDIEISIALDAGGDVKSEIVKASKDGKDITGDEKKKAAEREKKAAAEKAKAAKKDPKKAEKDEDDEQSHSFSLDDSPFNPERQDVVRVTETESRETIDGASCARFEFSYPEKEKPRSKDKPATVKGAAWIDEGSGRAVKVEFTMDPLPKHVKSMRSAMHYGVDASGPWVLKRMTFEAHGTCRVFAKRSRGDMLFSDYWKYERPDTTE